MPAKPKGPTLVKSTKAPKRKGNPLWKKGTSGNPKGRPRGAAGTKQQELKDICHAMTTGNPTYLANLQARIEAGKAPPAVEQMLWYYKWGKPKERVEVTGADGGPLRYDTSKLSRAELEAARDIARKAEAEDA